MAGVMRPSVVWRGGLLLRWACGRRQTVRRAVAYRRYRGRQYLGVGQLERPVGRIQPDVGNADLGDVPAKLAPSGPDLIHTWSPMSTGRTSSRTMPANTLERLCCAAMPTRTVANAPPTRSWVTAMPNSCR